MLVGPPITHRRSCCNTRPAVAEATAATEHRPGKAGARGRSMLPEETKRAVCILPNQISHSFDARTARDSWVSGALENCMPHPSCIAPVCQCL
jgi:hypothetical protein